MCKTRTVFIFFYLYWQKIIKTEIQSKKGCHSQDDISIASIFTFYLSEIYRQFKHTLLSNKLVYTLSIDIMRCIMLRIIRNASIITVVDGRLQKAIIVRHFHRDPAEPWDTNDVDWSSLIVRPWWWSWLILTIYHGCHYMCRHACSVLLST